MTSTRGKFVTRHTLLAVCALALAACGRDPEKPTIDALRYDGQAPDSPLVVLLDLDFYDGDGDLSAGDLESFIDGVPTAATAQPLLPLFIQSEVAPDAIAGTLGVVLELSFPGGKPPPSGTSFNVGARVTDGAKNTSETKSLRLVLEQ